MNLSRWSRSAPGYVYLEAALVGGFFHFDQACDVAY